MLSVNKFPLFVLLIGLLGVNCDATPRNGGNGSTAATNREEQQPPSNSNELTIGMPDAIKFMQRFDGFSNSILTKNYAHFSLPYRKEINKIILLLENFTSRWFRDAFLLNMQRIQQKIDQLNAELSGQRQIADIENEQVAVRFKRNDILPFEYDHPNEKFNIISRIFDTQYLTICIFFLDKFLENEQQSQIGRIMRHLEIKRKLLDLERYGRKREQFDWILKSNQKLIVKKLQFFDQNIENAEKNFSNSFLYKISYTEKQYWETIEIIERELSQLKFIWPQKGWEEEVEHFWTIDARLSIRQTLWVLPPAEGVDAEKSERGKGLDKKGRQEDPPLSKSGEEQMQTVAKWFEKVPITKVYASPFQRALKTATLLLGERRTTFINIEPGLGKFLKPCDVQLGFKQMSELHHQFPLTDPNYWPAYNKNALELAKRERSGREADVRNCHFMVEQTLRHILKESENAEHIVLVTHRATVGYLNQLLGAEWAVVDDATISKYVRYADVSRTVDNLRQFVVEYSGTYIN